MKHNIKLLFGFLVLVVGFVLSTNTAFAAYYYHANGGSYWSQSGSSWTYVNNDGYCVSGRGPCGSSLWYFQWTYNHSGCGFDEWGNWGMSQILPYNGITSAWIDGVGGGTMTGADYVVTYNYASGSHLTINQNNYWEQFAPLATLYRTSSVNLTDGWGTALACNSTSGKRVEFDEIRLDI